MVCLTVYYVLGPLTVAVAQAIGVKTGCWKVSPGHQIITIITIIIIITNNKSLKHNIKYVLRGINWKIVSTYEPKIMLTNSPA